MRLYHRAATAVAVLTLLGAPARAQQASDSTARRQQRTLDSLASALRTLQARLDSALRARAGGDTTGRDELAALRAAAAAASADSAPATRPQQQARLGLNALNPEISVTGDVRAHARSPGPQSDTFVPREFEVAFQSALDPFATGKVFLTAEDGTVALEEGYAYFTALPGHLRLDVGQFRQTVGELNRWHLHALNTDEYPLVVRRFAGEEGLVAPGVSLYWPVPVGSGFGAWELTVQATTGNNEVLFAGGNRPSVSAQLAASWQVSRATYAQLTVSALRGSNPDTSLTTTLGVASARFSWRPPAQALRREFTLRGELWALRRKFDLPGADAFDKTRLGGYADATWKLNRQWIAGVRGDYVESPERGAAAFEWALTPTLTYWTSEFVFLRALYERSRDLAAASTNRLTLQLVFAMGPHKHELF